MVLRQPLVKTTLAQVSAVWLIVLVIVPVTAPFQTCSASDLFGVGSRGRIPIVPPPGPAATLDDSAFALVPTVAPVVRQLKIAACIAFDRRGIDESADAFDLVIPIAAAPLPSVTLNAFAVLRV